MNTENENFLILPNVLRDNFTFEQVIDLGKKLSSEKAGLNLKNILFVEPYSMLALLLLGRNYLRDYGTKIKLINLPLNIQQYLTRMDFFEQSVFDIDKKLDERYLLKRSSFSSSVIEITEIPNKERESVKVIAGVISLFRKRANAILKHWLSSEIIDYFVTVISELCQNIFEHSLDSGFLAMQTYSVGKDKIFRLVIVDSGVGIKSSFEQKQEILFSSTSDLIKKVLTTPISSKREFGYGLCQVNSIVKKLKGTIFIRSDSSSITAFYNKSQGNNIYLFQKNDLSFFKGTQISITLTGK